MGRKLAWRQGDLIYTGQPLKEEFLADVSRYSDIKIELADPALENLPVPAAHSGPIRSALPSSPRWRTISGSMRGGSIRSMCASRQVVTRRPPRTEMFLAYRSPRRSFPYRRISTLHPLPPSGWMLVVKAQQGRLPNFSHNASRWIGLLAGLNHHKAGAKAKCANPLGQKMTFRGETLAAAALCGCLALSTPAFAVPSYAQASKYDVDISGADLMTALPALSRQTGAVVLYPYALAQVRRQSGQRFVHSF